MYTLFVMHFEEVLIVCLFDGVKCIYFWPEEGRAYVALGKVLCKQSRYDEARTVYERGCQATQGENAYIWQVYLTPLYSLFSSYSPISVYS